jgi:hypothetical protein
LRWAISQANAYSGAASIIFNPSLTGGNTITLTADLPIITNPNGVSIDGAGATGLTINGANSSLASVAARRIQPRRYRPRQTQTFRLAI